MAHRPHTKVVEVLQIDGGWLTTAGVALAAGVADDSADRTLYRWLARGWVERRTVPQDDTHLRVEWRAAPEPVTPDI